MKKKLVLGIIAASMVLSPAVSAFAQETEPITQVLAAVDIAINNVRMIVAEAGRYQELRDIGIKSLNEVDFFTNLVELKYYGNKITHLLDFSR